MGRPKPWAMAILLFRGLALCQPQGQELEECARVKNVNLPAADEPGPAVRESLAKCDSVDLYYGLTQPADPAKARQCAYLAVRRSTEPDLEDVAVLMMVYANGRGAARNFDVALKLACGFEGAPAELAGRVEHLARLKAEHWTGDDFSVCDDITSGRMHGWCAELLERVNGQRRAQRLSAVVSKWAGEDLRAFRLLEEAADAFFAARLEHEVDMTGSSRLAFQIGEEASLRDGLLSALEAFERGDMPRFSEEDSRKADAELNSLYQRIQNASDWDYGTVTRSGIRTTERTWSRYRDAWVKFGQMKYPAVSAESWKTWLTRDRVKMLAEFLR